MNSRYLLLAAAILAATSSPLGAQPQAADELRLPAELEGARLALEAFHQALDAGERGAALALLADDALIYEAGHAECKQEYAAHHLTADMAFAREVPASVAKRRGGLTGKVAWITTEGRTTGTFKGKAVDRRTVETALLREVGGRWVIQHLHWSSAAVK
jgi:ketosteroid isomerase-like protein